MTRRSRRSRYIYLIKKLNLQKEFYLRETEFYEGLDSVEKIWYADRRIDTVKGKIIDGAKFKVTEKDISPVPFITDNEIKNFVLNKNIITFDSVVVQRLKSSKPNIDNRQFVITSDRIPLLTGYFWNIFFLRLAIGIV